MSVPCLTIDDDPRHVCVAEPEDEACDLRPCSLCAEPVCMELPDRTSHDFDVHHAEEWAECWECQEEVAREDFADRLFVARGGFAR